MAADFTASNNSSLVDESNVAMDGALEEHGLHCNICSKQYDQPRVLSCLHVFCMKCIEENLNESNSMQCPTCSQITVIPAGGVTKLPLDFVLSNLMEVISCDAKPSSCGSCSSGESVVAKCFTCPNFLCQSCTNAHKSMKIFETHEVLRLQDMKTTISADGSGDAQVMEQQQKLYHKPLFCETHPSEHLKYFCSTCQVPICNECILTDHRQPYHLQNKIHDVEGQQTQDLRATMDRVSALTAGWREWSRQIQTSLDELQTQREQAQEAIVEAFQSFKAALEQRRNQMRDDLDALHKKQEMHLWDLSEAVDKDICRVEDGCKFVERLLSKGNGVEILSLRQLIMDQFARLLNVRRNGRLLTSMEFRSNEETYMPAVEQVFGRLEQHQMEDALKAAPRQVFVDKGKTNGSVKETMSSGPMGSIGDSLMLGALDTPPMSLVGSWGAPSAAAVTATPTNPVYTDDDMTYSRLLASTIGGVGRVTAASALYSSLATMSGPASIDTTRVPPARPQPSMHDITEDLDIESSRAAPFDGHGTDSPISDSSLTSSNPTAGVRNTLDQATLDMLQSTKMGGSDVAGLGLRPGMGGVESDFGLASKLAAPAETNSAMAFQSALQSLFETHAYPRADSSSPALSVSSGHGAGGMPNGAAGLFGLTPGARTPNLRMLELLQQQNQQSAAIDGRPLPSAISWPLDFDSNRAADTPSTTSLTAAAAAGILAQGGPGVPAPFPAMWVNPQMAQMGSPPTSQANLQVPQRSSKTTGMTIRAKFGQLGPGRGQFNSPHGFCLSLEEEIVIADTNNHRIQIFDQGGEFKSQFGIPGKEEGQLWYPRKVAVLRGSGKFVICDRGNERSRMQIFGKNGQFLRKIAIRFIDIVAGLAVTQSGTIVAVDSVSPSVFLLRETGELERWFDCGNYMKEPSDIAVHNNEFFVCDFKGHCVVVFGEEGTFLRRIGCENITNYPNGIDVSDAGDILVGDSHGNRFHVAVFHRDGNIIGEFECPYVKVSRCCGLKITHKGYIVTLAKNNHHVLVLNTLYIQ